MNVWKYSKQNKSMRISGKLLKVAAWNFLFKAEKHTTDSLWTDSHKGEVLSTHVC